MINPEFNMNDDTSKQDKPKKTLGYRLSELFIGLCGVTVVSGIIWLVVKIWGASSAWYDDDDGIIRHLPTHSFLCPRVT